MGKAPVVAIGLDAFDPGLALAWAASGNLPTLAGLLASGARCRVINPFGLFVGAVWISFASGRRPHRTHYHCWDEIVPGSYRWRLNPPKPELYEPFWHRVAAAGRRVAAVDVPHARARPGGATELFEYGSHDRHYGLHGMPAGLARRIAERFGLHPVLGLHGWRRRHFSPDDFYGRRGRYRTPDEERRLTAAFCAGAASKGGILRALWGEGDWDLFLAIFGECHGAGHQQWHLHDERHPRFDAAARDAAGGDPLLQVYRTIDAELGRLLALVPPEATILVHLSHGMTAHHDGTHLLDELLARLDGAGRSEEGRGASALDVVRPALPALRHLAQKAGVPRSLRAAVGQRIRGAGRRARARSRFFAAPNNSVVGGIRFNLAGREPQGCVAADEVEGLIAALERDLGELRNAATGGPVVRALHRSDGHYPRAAGDTMPDLFVEWERSAPIETVSSPKIGTLHVPYTHWRTGDHTEDGLLIARGPGLPAGAEMPAIEVEDIGPSIAALLGVALDDPDGKPAVWLTGEASGLRPEPAPAAAVI